LPVSPAFYDFIIEVALEKLLISSSFYDFPGFSHPGNPHGCWGHVYDFILTKYLDDSGN